MSAGSIFSTPPARKPTHGRLVVHKTVRDAGDPARRFDRRGFLFRLTDDQGTAIGADFQTDGSGRAVYDGELEIGHSFTLVEVSAPISNVQQLTTTSFTMSKPNMQLHVENVITVASTPYGS
jgi:hypothetical protein